MTTHTKSMSTDWSGDCSKVAKWARAIGLDIRKIDTLIFPDSSVESFISNIWIDSGAIYYNEQSHPGDLLHELGHIAVTPSWLRHCFKGDMNWMENPEAILLIDEIYDLVVDQGIETPSWKELINGDEQTAIAWSFIAAKAAEVNDFLPFENDFFSTSGIFCGDEVHESLASEKPWHPGIASLFHAGMLQNKTDFPDLCKWVQA